MSKLRLWGGEIDAVLLNDTCSSLNVVGKKWIRKCPSLLKRVTRGVGSVTVRGVNGPQQVPKREVQVTMNLNPGGVAGWVEVSCLLMPDFKGDILISAEQLRKWGTVIDMSKAGSGINYSKVGVKVQALSAGQKAQLQVLTLENPGLEIRNEIAAQVEKICFPLAASPGLEKPEHDPEGPGKNQIKKKPTGLLEKSEKRQTNPSKEHDPINTEKVLNRMIPIIKQEWGVTPKIALDKKQAKDTLKNLLKGKEVKKCALISVMAKQSSWWFDIIDRLVEEPLPIMQRNKETFFAFCLDNRDRA